jgi:CRP-like cAMP-binding protein
MLSNLDLIRRVPLFSMLSPAQAESLVGVVGKQRFKRGETLVKQGDTSHALFIILAGRVRVLLSDDKGREVILAMMGQGDYIGDMSLIDSQAHSATAVAEVQTDVLVLGRADFCRCLLDNIPMAMSVMRVLVKRLRSANQKIESLALMDVYDRVADVLRQSARLQPNGDYVILNKISRQDIAKMVGASREMVSRVMKDFVESGYVEVLADGGMRISERRLLAR